MSTTPTMLPHEQAIVAAVIAHEAEFGRPLPNSSFYKSLALQICRRHGIRV